MWTHSIYFLQLNLFNWIEGWHLVYTLSTTHSTIIDARALVSVCVCVGCVAMGEGFRACLTTPQFHCDQFINGLPRCPPASTALRWEMPLHFGAQANMQPRTHTHIHTQAVLEEAFRSFIKVKEAILQCKKKILVSSR